jgi:hypothetical protein
MFGDMCPPRARARPNYELVPRAAAAWAARFSAIFGDLYAWGLTQFQVSGV